MQTDALPFELDLTDGFVAIEGVSPKIDFLPSSTSIRFKTWKFFFNKKTKVYKSIATVETLEGAIANTDHVISYFSDLEHKVFHRLDGPALVARNAATGVLRKLVWYVNGVAHRDEAEGPADISYLTNGKPKTETYKKHGQIHRDADRPSVLKYKEFFLSSRNRGKGETKYALDIETWFRNGQIHRENGPASISYDLVKGNACVFVYFKQDKRHRFDGPASYNIVDKATYSEANEKWFINGEEITKSTRYPIIKAGKIINGVTLDRATILDASMFDREYGKFLLVFMKQQDTRRITMASSRCCPLPQL